MLRRRRDLKRLGIVLVTVAICVVRAQSPQHAGNISLATQDRIEDDPGWWPTKGAPARSAYVGAAACARCHSAILAVQLTTPMRQAGAHADQADILRSHPQLSFQDSRYNYALLLSGSQVTFTVSDGAHSQSSNVAWALGNGQLGQTYLLQDHGAFMESRLSYYTALNGLDITMGQSADVPATLAKALGNPLTSDTARRCLGCHTTAATTSNRFEPDQAIPGVTCEACHGPGALHVAAMTAQQYQRGPSTILNPARLSPSDSVDFCGACHRTWSDIVTQTPDNPGLSTLRFEPYRLEKSRCWGNGGDARLTCMACHDPHQPLLRDTSAYDPKCLACHRVNGMTPQPTAMAPACKISTHNCASCHMPKYELPQSHAKFTDHYIRVVQAGAGFPS